MFDAGTHDPFAGALPGTLFTAAAWTGLQMLFQLVAVPVSRTTVVGTFGAVLLAVTWLSVRGLLLLVGATRNVVVVDRSASTWG